MPIESVRLGQTPTLPTQIAKNKKNEQRNLIPKKAIKKAKEKRKPTFIANQIAKRGLSLARALSKRRYSEISEDLKPFLKTSVNEPLLDGCKEIPLLDFYDPKNTKATVVFFHGVAENNLNNQNLYKKFLEMGCRVIAPEYGGFGKHLLKSLDGRAMKKYAKAINDYLKSQKIDPKQTVLISHSFGVLPLSWLAQEIPNARFAIIASPFHSFSELRNNLVSGKMWRLTENDKNYLQKPGCIQLMDSILDTDSSKRLSLSKLFAYIIHGNKDEVVPYPSSQELKKKTGLKLITLKEDGHSINDAKIKKILKILRVIISDDFKIKRKRIFNRFMKTLMKKIGI